MKMHMIAVLVLAVCVVTVEGKSTYMYCNPDNCQTDPCFGQTCSGSQGALCYPNYCGGCTQVFYDVCTKAKITNCISGCTETEDSSSKQCDEEGACANPSCPTYKATMQCVEFCGGCHAHYLGPCGIRLSEADCDCKKAIADCALDPCSGRTCPSQPDALCVPNYCGACTADFFDYNGCKMDCDRCPDGKKLQKCDNNICRQAKCHKYPDADCVLNECTCEPEFYVNIGRLGTIHRVRVDCSCRETIDVECSALCDGDAAKCTNFPTAFCVRNHCSCTAEFYDECRNKVKC